MIEKHVVKYLNQEFVVLLKESIVDSEIRLPNNHVNLIDFLDDSIAEHILNSCNDSNKIRKDYHIETFQGMVTVFGLCYDDLDYDEILYDLDSMNHKNGIVWLDMMFRNGYLKHNRFYECDIKDGQFSYNSFREKYNPTLEEYCNKWWHDHPKYLKDANLSLDAHKIFKGSIPCD